MSRPSSPMVFVFEDDEIRVLHGGEMSTVTTPTIDRGLSGPASPSFSPPPLRARTPPPPPPKITPKIGRGSGFTPAEYDRAVLFPELYSAGKPLSSAHDIDIEALVERSYSPVGDPYADSDDDSFEQLHTEFMDRILLSGDTALSAADEARAAVRASIFEVPLDVPAAASSSGCCMSNSAATSTTSIPLRHDPVDNLFDEPPKTPHVTEPLNIQKRTPSPTKSLKSDRSARVTPRSSDSDNEDNCQGSAQHASSSSALHKYGDASVQTDSDDKAGSIQRRALVQAQQAALGLGTSPPRTRPRPRPAGPRASRTFSRSFFVASPEPDEAERTPSPSPPLIRTPDTPPAPMMTGNVRGFFPTVPSPNLHARREANRANRLESKDDDGSENENDKSLPAAALLAPSQPPSARQSPSGRPRPLPTIVIPPIALGPLPPLPDGAEPTPKSRGLRSSPSRSPVRLSPASPPLLSPPVPTPPTPSPTASYFGPTGFSNRPNRTSAISSNSGTGSGSGGSINRPGSSNSSRRPASMQPQASPRLSPGAGLLRSPQSPHFGNRPATAFHFGGITIPASSPVVQAFEDIGAIGIISPTSPFTQPRPAPRPSGLGAAWSGPPEPLDDPDEPTSPVTPTAPREVPAKARALLGLYPVADAPKKSSPFSKLGWGRNHDKKEDKKEDKEKDHVGVQTSPKQRQRSPEPISIPFRKGRNRSTSSVEARPALDLWRARTNDSTTAVNTWDNPENFAPLSGHARTVAGGSGSYTGGLGGSFPVSEFGAAFSEHAYERERERDRDRDRERHPPRPKRPPFLGHGQSDSFGSTHSLASVAESTYPVSVLSHKSSFELSPPAKVYSSPRVGTPGSHKSKSSLDGIPNLTPNSKAGVYAPAPSDKLFKSTGQYHAPSLSPITYTPPPGGNPEPIVIMETAVVGPPRTSSLAAKSTIAPPKRSPPPPPTRSPPARSPPKLPALPSGSSSDEKDAKKQKRPPPIKVQRGKVPASSGSAPAAPSSSGTADAPAHPFAAAGHKVSTSLSERYPPPPPPHIPVNLHLRESPHLHVHVQPHPPHPSNSAGLRPRAASRASVLEESYFEPETPSPRGHFKGLRNVVKGWDRDNRI